jgi:hypothetical protein
LENSISNEIFRKIGKKKNDDYKKDSEDSFALKLTPIDSLEIT